MGRDRKSKMCGGSGTSIRDEYRTKPRKNKDTKASKKDNYAA